jgi:hypothetical protein
MDKSKVTYSTIPELKTEEDIINAHTKLYFLNRSIDYSINSDDYKRIYNHMKNARNEEIESFKNIDLSKSLNINIPKNKLSGVSGNTLTLKRK